MNPSFLISNPDADDFFLYAETAFHHEGDLSYLQKLVAASADANVDGVKFQILLDAASAYSETLPQFDKIKSWCFDEMQWLGTLRRAKELGLHTVVMPIDTRSVEFALRNEELVDAYEIHSVCFNDHHMLMALSPSTKPVLLNIGGRRPEEIRYTLEMLPHQSSALIYGLQNFPTEPSALNLSRIAGYRKLFGRCMGYADHTTADTPETGTALSCYAYALGCRIFERHIAIERGTRRVDSQAAVMPEEIRAMRRNLTEARAALGTPSILHSTAFDDTYRKRQKQLVFARDMHPGEALTSETLRFMVTSEPSDFEQKDYFKLAGRRVCRPVLKHQPVLFGDIGRINE
ncbi:MAG: N-acetylneuraminate synthase family protein [Desulfatitalea sp.]